MLDFTEPSGSDPLAMPRLEKTSLRLSTSTTSPTRVDVPWPSMRLAESGFVPAFSHARLTANFWPTGFGAVMPLPLPSEDPAKTADDRIDVVATLLGVLESLEEEDSGSLSHHEPIGPSP